ncbi:VOC family protein [Micromonospora aurantiaca (nom. illeg.)]|uniref:VOC family protein n=1 Tax=Micromonospora aurantiaca (nom. illeg.) TaxID=47850 RepID=UPI00378E5817
MRIVRADHLVLTVTNIAATIAWYQRVLGMQPVTFAAGRHALTIGGQKLNLHQAGHELEPHAAHPAPGTVDLCLISAVPWPRSRHTWPRAQYRSNWDRSPAPAPPERSAASTSAIPTATSLRSPPTTAAARRRPTPTTCYHRYPPSPSAAPTSPTANR